MNKEIIECNKLHKFIKSKEPDKNKVDDLMSFIIKYKNEVHNHLENIKKYGV